MTQQEPIGGTEQTSVPISAPTAAQFALATLALERIASGEYAAQFAAEAAQTALRVINKEQMSV